MDSRSHLHLLNKYISSQQSLKLNCFTVVWQAGLTDLPLPSFCLECRPAQCSLNNEGPRLELQSQHHTPCACRRLRMGGRNSSYGDRL